MNLMDTYFTFLYFRNKEILPLNINFLLFFSGSFICKPLRIKFNPVRNTIKLNDSV